MKKYLFNFVVLGIGIICSVFVIGTVMAQTVSEIPNIQYPVKELNNCVSEKECKVHCDKTENINTCLSFAEENNLMSKEEIKIAKKFANKEIKGPGGCDEKNECDAYCDDMDNMDECISFAEKNNLIPEKELEEAKKVQAAIKKGIKPPACGNKNECDAYCEESNHMEECVNFGIAAGFIQGEELENAQKMLSALKRGVKPPPCKGKDACDEYCQKPDNMEICMNFAIEAGMMGDSEKKDAEKMLQALKKGIKPPNCKGKEECDIYCQSEEHMDECINFSVAAGFMNEKEAEMAKKTKGKGPGGCMGKEECETFCQNNQEECFKFGVENGMIPPEELQKMEQNRANFKQTFNNLPPEVETCLKESIGGEQLEKFKNSEIMPQKETGDQMRICFEKNMPQSGQKCEGDNCPPPGEGNSMGMQMAPGTTGPGGCKTQEDCKSYCESNPEECKKFQPGSGMTNPGGQMMPQQSGPGGCKGPEECKAYCEKNPDQCKNFQQGFEQGGTMGFSNQGGAIVMPPCEGENCVKQPMQGIQQPIMNQQLQQNIQQFQENIQQFPQDQQPIMQPPSNWNENTQPNQDGQQFPTGMQPPVEMQQPTEQQFPQDQQPTMESPSSEEQPISRNTQKQSLLANILNAFLSLFR